MDLTPYQISVLILAGAMFATVLIGITVEWWINRKR